MSSRLFVVLSLSILTMIPIGLSGQSAASRPGGIRCGYQFFRKYTSEADYTKFLNMRLDYYDGQSAFYDEFTFERDSLRLLAFDENGRTKNQTEYNKMQSLPRPRLGDFTLIDYKKNTVTQVYKQATITIRGDYEIVAPPSWKLTNEVRTIGDYNCKKAIASYLGRTWIVWYTEDVPLPIGPWMLWSTPGLIVFAEDNEHLFCFQLLWTETLENNDRFAFIEYRYPRESFQERSFKYFALPMKEAELMNDKLKTDASYMVDLIGGRPGDMDGLQSRMKYIPLIPNDYWRSK